MQSFIYFLPFYNLFFDSSFIFYGLPSCNPPTLSLSLSLSAPLFQISSSYNFLSFLFVFLFFRFFFLFSFRWSFLSFFYLLSFLIIFPFFLSFFLSFFHLTNFINSFFLTFFLLSLSLFLLQLEVFFFLWRSPFSRIFIANSSSLKCRQRDSVSSFKQNGVNMAAYIIAQTQFHQSIYLLFTSLSSFHSLSIYLSIYLI
ncbi:unnamed protein product [Acanthosepion pharaonis]|uniref:Uncharacterized protein n=1 Tax=Acanthosepion pharaonis TaxID=158019 RepID=A0A812CJ71_ACAPH|nr:unnamed protein product [Sepia pharaonis]